MNHKPHKHFLGALYLHTYFQEYFWVV